MEKKMATNEQVYKGAKRAFKVSLPKSSGLVWVLFGLCVIATILSPAFLSQANMTNVFRQIALYGFVSIGMTFVILTKGIDLSVGSIIGVCAVTTALLLGQGWPIALAIPAVLVVGMIMGVISGVGIAVFQIPPFIMTLGMMVMGRGLALTLAYGQPISLGSRAMEFSWLGRGMVAGVPVPVMVFALAAAIAFFVLRYTAYGRQVFAVGSNSEAARLSGINVTLVTFSVYVVSAFLAALTALIFVSRLTVGEPTAGTGIELEAIAITVIGGTSLFGGEGGINGTIIGTAILSVLANIMNLVGISPFTQQIIKGAIIVVAVLYEMLRRRKGRF